MRRALFILALVLLPSLGRAACWDAAGTDRWVCPSAGPCPAGSSNGSDTANTCNVKASPCATVQKAVDSALAGDTICVAAGTYRELVAITSKNCTADLPCAIEGDTTAATIDGSALVTSGWVAVGAGDPVITTGADGRIWKQTFTVGGVVPDAMFWDRGTGDGPEYILRLGLQYGTSTPLINLGCAETNSGCDILKNGPCSGDTWGAGCVYRDWDPMGGATFGVKPSTGAVYVRFEDGSSPNGKAISFAPADRGVIHFTTSAYVTIRGVTLRGSQYGVWIDSGSDDITVEDSIISAAGYGIAAWGAAGSNPRADRVTIRRNTIRLNASMDVSPTANTQHWFVWNAFRNFSKLEIDGARMAIMTYEAGDDILIEGNLIEDCFDGIDAVTNAGTYNNTTIFRRLIIRDNVIRRCANDAIDAYTSQDLQIHDNRIEDVNGGWRTGIEPGPGPAYFYDNTVWTPTVSAYQTAATGIYFYAATAAPIRIYHNAFSVREPFGFGKASPSVCGRGDGGYCMHNVRLYDNIWSALQSNAWAPTWNASTRKPTVDYNWSTYRFKTIGDGGHNIISGTSMWPPLVDPYPFAPTGLAINAGLNLDRANVVCTTACPGVTYYPDGVADMGARLGEGEE